MVRLCVAGSNGVRTLTSMLKRIDRNGNHKLERDELKEGLAIFGIDVDDSPVRGHKMLSTAMHGDV